MINQTALDYMRDHAPAGLSEHDIHCQAAKRQISGGSKIDTGRDCRDAFMGLAKTCRELVVAVPQVAPGPPKWSRWRGRSQTT